MSIFCSLFFRKNQKIQVLSTENYRFITFFYTECNRFVTIMTENGLEEIPMGLNKVMKQLCVTAALVVLSTVTAFAANVGQASGTNVNVRAGASTGANVLGKINKGTEYTVLDKVDNWFKISYNGATGYVFADYFSVTKADGSITGSGVNLREKATTASNSLKKFSSGEAVTVTGQNDDWYRVSYNGGSAYVSKDYVSGNLLQYVSKVSSETTAAPVSATTKAEDTYGVVTAGSGLKLRKEASTSAEVLTVLPSGTIVDVERAGQDWVSIVTDAGQKGYVSADYLTVKTGEKPDNTTSNTASAKGAAVVAYGKQFIGTPYVWGGTNLNTGVDCSGFVYAVYKNFGITLSRSSASMTSNGVEVSKANLQAGDLVFFNTGGNSSISHVGIYCGDGTYVHSTDGKGNGVTVTNLNSGYSANTYVTARRIF